MSIGNLRVNNARLLQSLAHLAEVGAIEGGGVCRLALSDEDRDARDLVVSWMRDAGLQITVDQAGNVIGTRKGISDGPPVLMGSHIDTVGTGGRYDGTLGVLAGLEVIRTLNDAGIDTEHPVAVGFFSNEEGVRFQPDMMGSMIHQGHLPIDEMLLSEDREGNTYDDELIRIGYKGEVAVDDLRPLAFLELHVEQGPILEFEDITIGAVGSVQGISWRQYTFLGTSNHAGTTPMSLRKDAGHGATMVACFARTLALEIGGNQVATAGSIILEPNMINVVARKAIVTVDLRNTDNEILIDAEDRMDQFAKDMAISENLQLEIDILARYDPTPFNEDIIQMIATNARELGNSVREMPSGAGHDAQAFAPNCPTGMIFVPSVDGISHNINEFTCDDDIESGSNVLLQTVLNIACNGLPEND